MGHHADGGHCVPGDGRGVRPWPASRPLLRASEVAPRGGTAPGPGWGAAESSLDHGSTPLGKRREPERRRERGPRRPQLHERGIAPGAPRLAVSAWAGLQETLRDFEHFAFLVVFLLLQSST